MTKKIQPIGNPTNPHSWKNIFDDSKERANFQTTLVRLDVSSFDRKDKFRLKKGLGERKFDKLIKARYDWLFDDLQKFSSVGAETINSKEDLRAFVEETIGESPAFKSLKKGNSRRYDIAINNATNSFWSKGGVRSIAETNVVEVVDPDRAKSFSLRVNESKRERFIEASKKQELYRIRRERFATLGTDKRGRTFFYDLQTGRRVPNPQKILAEVGLEQSPRR